MVGAPKLYYENKECKLKYTPTEDMIADMGKNFENIYGRNRNASDELMIQRITNKTLMLSPITQKLQIYRRCLL